MRCRMLLLLALLLGWTSLAMSAPSLQYVLPGGAITFADSAQTPTVTFTLSALASGAGQYSARYDKNALATATGAMPALWQIACHLQLTGTNVPGATVEVYLVRWDAAGSNSDGNLGTTTASLTSDKRRNLQFVGTLVVDQSTSNVTMAANWTDIRIVGRYFSLALWNATGLPLKTDTAVHGCAAIPTPFQMQ